MQFIDALTRGAGENTPVNAQRRSSGPKCGSIAVINLVVQRGVDALLRMNKELILGEIRRCTVYVDAGKLRN